MTLNYIELKKEYETKKKQDERAKKLNKTQNNDSAYELRIKFQAKSTWNGTYSKKQ